MPSLNSSTAGTPSGCHSQLASRITHTLGFPINFPTASFQSLQVLSLSMKSKHWSFWLYQGSCSVAEKNHCTTPLRHASARHRGSQDRLAAAAAARVLASTAASARTPQPRPARRYCCLRRCHLLIPSLGHPSIRESFSAHLWARGLSGSRHLKRFAGLHNGRSRS